MLRSFRQSDAPQCCRDSLRERDIFRHREVGKQRRLLIDDGDAERLRFGGRQMLDPLVRAAGSPSVRRDRAR